MHNEVTAVNKNFLYIRVCHKSMLREIIFNNKNRYFTKMFPAVGYAVSQWLRHCATYRKVAGSIPDGVMGIFQK
jgi:hypothetical protein